MMGYRDGEVVSERNSPVYIRNNVEKKSDHTYEE